MTIKPVRFFLLMLIGFLVFALTGTADAASPASNIKVVKIGEPDLDTIIESYKGKVLLVSVWATWCKPCREEFPDLVRLARFYKGKNVEVIAISADYPDEIESKILPFLKKFPINFPVYVQGFARQEDFINRMNKEWSGALPAAFIYDKSGRQQVFIIGKRDYESFLKEIREVVKQE